MNIGNIVNTVPLLLIAGCMSTSGGLQTARTAPPGDWQVTGGMTMPVSTRFVAEIADVIDQATDELQDGDPVTPEEEREATISMLGIVLFQPTPITVIALRRGVVQDVDVGVRHAGPALRVDAKWRFMQTDGGMDVALDAGYTHHTDIGASAASSVYDLFDSLKLVSYSRYDLDVNVLASSDVSARWQYYGAARYAAGFTNFETLLDDAIDAVDEAGVRDTEATMHQLGASVGGRFGGERFGVLAELTVMRVLFSPEILGAEAELGGWIVEPSVGLTGTF